MTAARLYAFLLRAFPRRFRERYGAEMQRVFAARHERAAARGRWAATVFLVASGADVLWNASLERGAAVRRWLQAPRESEPASSAATEGRPLFWAAIGIDLRHAVRMSLRSPGFTIPVVLALALGIGSVSAIVSVIGGILLNPLPYEQPDRLVMIWSDNTREGRPEYPMSPANVLDYKASARMVEHVEPMFSFITAPAMTTPEGSEQIALSVVSPGMFSLLGRQAAIGRTLVPDDKAGVVVLSAAFWARRFGRAPSVVGQRLIVDNAPVVVAGVMPPDFLFPFQGMLGPSGFTPRIAVDMWAVLDPSRDSRFMDAAKRPVRNVHFLSVLARLAPGASLAQARDEASSIAGQLERAFPETNTGLGANVVALHEQSVGRARPALLLIAVGACLVLLLASVNVANLVLAKGVSRHKELAVRAALGAGRSRLLQQTLSETLLLSCCGGAAGLLLARWAIQAFVTLAPRSTPRLADIHLDWRVVMVTLAVSAGVGFVLGLVPLLAGEAPGAAGALNEASRGNSTGIRGRRMRSRLAAAEVAFAVVLTIGAGLLIRSFMSVVDVDPGFHSERLLTLQVTLPPSVSTPDARRAFYQDLFARLEAIPGVLRAGGTTRLPLGSTNVTSRVAIEGRSQAPADRVEVEFRRAVHAYFQTMGMPIVRGRDFQDSDGPGSPPVVVVNQAMARRVWGEANPVGRRVRTDDAAPWSTVIGVVGDIRHARLDEPPMPEMYISYLAGPPVSPYIVVRTSGDPATLAEPVRSTLRTLDRNLVVFDLRTGDDLRTAAASPRRFVAVLGGLFGVLALALAAVGVYGVMALTVTERVQEMGIRMALGAAPSSVFSMVVRQGLALATLGIAIGLVLSIALMPLMANQLFGVSALDPVTLAAVPAVLFVTALVACAWPAWRAMRVDPMTALHCD